MKIINLYDYSFLQLAFHFVVNVITCEKGVIICVVEIKI